ncbi:uncharacterized protein [Triticum aestivum]|uniref:uncharacterized protein n=1 Tax=Triticum aestivum TaxID=4565 RepID=UPI001D00F252|nr:uncharacterized protein LOC123157632 [Triticum aestivum]
MRRAEEPGEHQGAPARWWWWLASSPRRWLRFVLVRRWRRRWWWVASPSPMQEEAPEASGYDAAASPHNDVLAAALLNGSSPAHLPALEANLAASLAGVESSASTPSLPLLQEGAPGRSDHGTAASTRSDASSPAPLPALGANLDASLASVESSASTTSALLLREGVAEASEHGTGASLHSDVLVAAVLNDSPPCHPQEGPKASGHGVAAPQHTDPTSPSPPDSCDGTIISLEEEVAVVVEQLSGHRVAASQHTAPTLPSLPDSCDGAIICLESSDVD